MNDSTLPQSTRQAPKAPIHVRLAECEKVIERGLNTFVEVGNAIREIRDERLYRESFATFEEYCQTKWGWSRVHAHRHIEAANTAELLPIGNRPANEAQARELAPLAKEDPDRAREVFTLALQDAAERGVKLTAQDVKQAVSAVVKRKEKDERQKERLAERARAAESMESITLDKRVQVVHADFRDALDDLPENSVDLVLTDPPYPAEYIPLYSDLGHMASECLKDGGVLACMVGQSYLPDIINRLSERLTYHWTVAYTTLGGQAVQLWQRRVNTFWKPVLIFTKGEYAGDWFGDVAKSDVNDNDKRFHHWGQSESGTSDLMERLSKPGDMVVDPFVGGGTTAIVAALTHRRFLGCDLDAKAIETTTYRLAELTKEVARVGA